MLIATSWIGELLFRLGAKVQGRPLLRLTTTGARSGKSRTRVLCWFPDHSGADSWVVVASNNGSARHPGWAYNLARYPDRASVDVGKGRVDVTAQILTALEREAAWDLVVELAPRYEAYEAKTDRNLPVFRLSTRQ